MYYFNEVIEKRATKGRGDINIDRKNRDYAAEQIFRRKKH